MSQDNSATLFGLAPSLEGNNWMSRFDGSTSLAQLTIPGTHDSGALYNLDTSGESRPLYEFAVNTVVPIASEFNKLAFKAANVLDNLSTIVYYAARDTTVEVDNPDPNEEGTIEIPLHQALTNLQNQAIDLGNSIPPLGSLVNSDLAQAQSLTITEQLEAGVRFLDLRGRPVNDTLEVFHGAIPQGQNFGEAFGAINSFVEANPSESVVVYTQQENGNELPFDLSDPAWLADLTLGDIPLSSAKFTELVSLRDSGAQLTDEQNKLLDESLQKSQEFGRSPLFVTGQNLSAFFAAQVQELNQIRPDYLQDLQQNYQGATNNGSFKSTEATNNFFNLLSNNYDIEVTPLTQETFLGEFYEYLDLSSYSLLLRPVVFPFVEAAQAGVDAVVLELNSVVAELGMSWLELQQTADASMVFKDGKTIVNGPYNTDLSYDELLDGYIQEMGAENFYLENDVPTLDEARGKIVLMVRDMDGTGDSNNIPLGIERPRDPDNTPGHAVENGDGEVTLVYQDYYEPGTADRKWNAFNTLADAAVGDKNAPSNLVYEDALYVNYLSATSEEAYNTFDIDKIGPVGYAFNTPVEIDGATYQGLNAALEDVFLEQRPDGRYGSMLVDFIDESMARQIFEMNSAVGSALALDGALKPTVMRVDAAESDKVSVQNVSFGLQKTNSPTPDMILQSNAPAALPHSLDMLDGQWQARESLALGDIANAQQDLAAGVYVPVALLADGTALAIQNVTAHDPSHIEVTFVAPEEGMVAPRAVFKLEGMESLVVPADTDTAVNVQVARLGQFTNGLAFYEAEQGTGAITVDGKTLLPGDDGYLQGALNLAKSAGTVIRADQMPEFGETASFADLDLEAGLTYGILLMHEDNEGDLSSSFSDANRDGHSQIVELPSADGSIWYGMEDLHVATGGSDRDFNDLLVNVQFA